MAETSALQGEAVNRSQPAPPPELRRVLNVLLGVAIVVGGAIGAGILRTPGIIAGELVYPWLIVAAWIGGGLIAMLGANCYAELATALPKAGGPYVYARRAFGPFAGFAVGWGDWAISITAIAFMSVAIAEFLGVGAAGSVATHVVAVAMLAAVGLLNWFGLKVGARTQQWLSFAKVAGLVGLTIACLTLAGSQSEGPAPPPLGSGHVAVLAFMSSLVIVSETYAGWNSSVYFAEEDEDAARNAPRALFWGIAAITSAYVLFNIGLLAALPVGELASSKLPAADAAKRVFGEGGGNVVTVLAVVSVIGILNVTVMFTPRIVFGMSRDGYLPAILSKLNRSASPGIAMGVTLLFASVLAAGLEFETLFGVAAFLGVAVNAVVFLCLFRLRATEPELPRPYRARGYPWLPGIVVLISLALLISFIIADPFSSAVATATLLASWPIYRVTVRRHAPAED